MASSSSSVTSRIRGASAATTLGVNAWLTNRRSLRCRGGSIWVSMPSVIVRIDGINRVAFEENSSGSEVSRSTSA
jgi:hypothetical protein